MLTINKYHKNSFFNNLSHQFFFILISLSLASFNTNAQEPFKNPFFDNLEPGSYKGSFYMEGSKVWGTSVIQHDDGKYYMFASVWSDSTGKAQVTSQIAVAVSDKPEGPYEYIKIILPRRDKKYWDGRISHNPAIQKHEGTYYLFYTGNTYSFDWPKDIVGNRDPRFFEAWNNKRVGVATAKHPLGPWKRYDEPLLKTRPGHWDLGITSNAAPIIHDDGSVTIFYKGTNLPMPERFERDEDGNHILKNGLPRFIVGVARADNVFGPYERLGEHDGMISIEGQFVSLEDPYAWYDGTYYHMVVKNFDQEFCDEKLAALYIRSKDAVHWKLPEDEPRAYSREVTWKEGMTTYQPRLEKPSILFENGKPAWFFLATRFSDENNELCQCESCVYNVVFKIKQ